MRLEPHSLRPFILSPFSSTCFISSFCIFLFFCLFFFTFHCLAHLSSSSFSFYFSPLFFFLSYPQILFSFFLSAFCVLEQMRCDCGVSSVSVVSVLTRTTAWARHACFVFYFSFRRAGLDSPGGQVVNWQRREAQHLLIERERESKNQSVSASNSGRGEAAFKNTPAEILIFLLLLLLSRLT